MRQRIHESSRTGVSAIRGIVLTLCAPLTGVRVPATTDAGTSLIDGTVSYEDGSPVKFNRLARKAYPQAQVDGDRE